MPERSMKAVVIAGPRTAELREVACPRPKESQVVIDVEGCGLCGSNLPVWEGRPWFDYPVLPPGTPGHEGWGRVREIGPGVTGIRTGDRVTFLSTRALAEQALVGTDELVPLPPSLDDKDVPGEPLGCAMNIWRRSDVSAGDNVAVVGAGFFGALLVQLASRAGARVIAASRRPFSLELARRMGADETVELGDDAASEIMALTGGRGCERVIEAAGLQSTLDLASAVCAIRGRLVIAGFHQDGPRRLDLQLWNWRGIDVINAHERDPAIYVDGMQAGIDALESGRVDIEPLLSHRVPLERAAAGFELLRNRPEGFVKALVIP